MFYHFAPCAEISLVDPVPQFQKSERVCLKTDTTFHRKEQCGKVEYSFENWMSQVRFGILGSKNSEVVSDNDLTTGN